MSKTIILCADDFGQAPHISQAILALAANKRLSAISCMTTEEDWVYHGSLLKSFQNHLDIGLHFNLTHGKRHGDASVNKWLLRSFSNQIDQAFIEASLHEQLDRFETIMGFSPDFIDGHQHVHCFPIIRNVLTKVIKSCFPNQRPYVRTLTPMLYGADSSLKALVIKGAASGFSRALDLQGINHNPRFGGLYSLHPQAPYRYFMNRWFQQATRGTLLMCHPGNLTRKVHFDPIQEARVKEYSYLSSNAFSEDCEKTGIILGRLEAFTSLQLGM